MFYLTGFHLSWPLNYNTHVHETCAHAENKTTACQYTITNNRCKIEFMNSLIDVHLVKWWLVHKTAKMSLIKVVKTMNWRQVKKVVLVWCDNFLKPKSSLKHVLFTYMLTIIIGHTDYYENNMRCDEIGLIRWLVRSLHYSGLEICELNWFDVDLEALQEGQQSIDSATLLKW